MNRYRRLAAVAALALAGCARPAHPPADPRPNILLLSIDTLRADHLGIYGYTRDTSPVIDRLAAGAVRFTRVWAPTPWTLPSHAALLTGVHPWDLGMWHNDSVIPSRAPTLAQLLLEAGYQTAAFVDSGPEGYVGDRRGFARGFEEYHHAPHRADLAHKYDMAATREAAVRWLERREAGRPYFLFLHTKSVHAVPQGSPCLDARCLPYDKPEPYRSRFLGDPAVSTSWSAPEMGSGQEYLWSINRSLLDGDRDRESIPRHRIELLEALYDAGIFYVDEQLGLLLGALDRLDLRRGTAIVVTSDHGEAFLEHQLLMHQEVYSQLLRVPLIFEIPGGPSGRVVEAPVALTDIAPTLLRLAGVESPADLSGRPLPFAGAASSGPPRELFAYYLFPSRFSYRAFALEVGDHKLVRHNFRLADGLHTEFYDPQVDPAELHPLSVGAEMHDLMVARLDELISRSAALGPVRLSDDTAAAELKSLGYID